MEKLDFSAYNLSSIAAENENLLYPEKNSPVQRFLQPHRKADNSRDACFRYWPKPKITQPANSVFCTAISNQPNPPGE
jgi:hypothetical protein